ncbi:hypothetical protein PVAP13_7NG184651 [Panicum virgatum]|uniref:Uncharacterized protein n=1 Tax=Panicum virgatum TaxID=38727 RepID=A0A8T0Q1R5_PANVG|nr:hypothetical protein PVAP13_7NG184651 [Panicum virgatum]
MRSILPSRRIVMQICSSSLLQRKSRAPPRSLPRPLRLSSPRRSPPPSLPPSPAPLLPPSSLFPHRPPLPLQIWSMAGSTVARSALSRRSSTPSIAGALPTRLPPSPAAALGGRRGARAGELCAAVQEQTTPRSRGGWVRGRALRACSAALGGRGPRRRGPRASSDGGSRRPRGVRADEITLLPTAPAATPDPAPLRPPILLAAARAPSLPQHRCSTTADAAHARVASPPTARRRCSPSCTPACCLAAVGSQDRNGSSNRHLLDAQRAALPRPAGVRQICCASPSVIWEERDLQAKESRRRPPAAGKESRRLLVREQGERPVDGFSVWERIRQQVAGFGRDGGRQPPAAEQQGLYSSKREGKEWEGEEKENSGGRYIGPVAPAGPERQ